MRFLSTTMMMLVLFSLPATANDFEQGGTDLEVLYGYNWLEQRYLINDGSFEQGTCAGGSYWTCTSDNDCDWIVDLVPLGLWNYDGMHVAWLGGFCGGVSTIFSSICQEIYIDNYEITWYWMAYVNEGGSLINISVDGETVYSYVSNIGDHLLGYVQEYAWIGSYWGTHELCFNYSIANSGGDNYFVDYVELGSGPMPAKPMSFSCVKALY